MAPGTALIPWSQPWLVAAVVVFTASYGILLMLLDNEAVLLHAYRTIAKRENAVDLLFGFGYRIFFLCRAGIERRAHQNGKIGTSWIDADAPL